jgi:hypothetical protein
MKIGEASIRVHELIRKPGAPWKGDPAKKIPAEMIEKMKEARLATEGMRYRRQFAFASLDLALHGPHPEGHPGRQE